MTVTVILNDDALTGLTEWLHGAGSYCDIGEGDEGNDGVCDGRCRLTADEAVSFLARKATAPVSSTEGNPDA